MNTKHKRDCQISLSNKKVNTCSRQSISLDDGHKMMRTLLDQTHDIQPAVAYHTGYVVSLFRSKLTGQSRGI